MLALKLRAAATSPAMLVCYFQARGIAIREESSKETHYLPKVESQNLRSFCIFRSFRTIRDPDMLFHTSSLICLSNASSNGNTGSQPFLKSLHHV